MKPVADSPSGQRRPRHAERAILFFIANQMFAIAADAVQEIRSTDGLAGSAIEIDSDVPKARHMVERGRHIYYVVSGCAHFGLRITRPALVLILRQVRVAVLVDRIDRMAEIPGVHALPPAFIGDERRWYRGLTYIDDMVIPVIDPAGFLSSADFHRLDRVARAALSQRELEGAVQA